MCQVLLGLNVVSHVLASVHVIQHLTLTEPGKAENPIYS